MRAKKTALGLAAVGGVLALAACGSNSTNGNGGNTNTSQAHIVSLLNQAVTNAHNAKSFAIKGTMTSNGATITLDGTGSVEPLAMEATMSGGPLATLAGSNNGMEVRIIDGTFYLKSSFMGMGKPWTKLDMSTTGPQGQAMTDLMRNVNPIEDLRLLANGQSLTDVGAETVDGVPTEHYHGTVPVSAVLGASSQGLSPQEQAQLKQMWDQSGVASEDMDVWLDNQGRAVRAKAVAHGTQGTTTADRHLSNWGVPVNVTPPPADEVTDIGGMLGQLGGASGAPTLPTGIPSMPGMPGMPALPSIPAGLGE